MLCKQCGKNLTYNEIGLHKKLIGKTQKTFFCKSCLAEYLGVSVKLLEEKQKQYIKAGCLLFVKDEAR